jgi:hypothetical protein
LPFQRDQTARPALLGHRRVFVVVVIVLDARLLQHDDDWQGDEGGYDGQAGCDLEGLGWV